MPTAVLDTNFFLIPGRNHKDVLSLIEAEGYTIILLKQVHRELTKLSEGQSETASAARIALQLIKRKGLNTVSGSVRYTDNAILTYCQEHGAAAATQDVALRRTLRAAGVRVLTLNRSGKLAMEE
jgi:rRNA-processing protein FCF1